MVNEFPQDSQDTGADVLSDEQVWDLLSLYADGEATPAEAACIERLLLSHATLRRDLEWMRSAGAATRLLDEVSPPPALREAIFAATIHRVGPMQRVAAAWRQLTEPFTSPRRILAASGVAAAVFAVWLWPTSDHRISEPSFAHSFYRQTSSGPVAAHTELPVQSTQERIAEVVRNETPHIARTAHRRSGLFSAGDALKRGGETPHLQVASLLSSRPARRPVLTTAPGASAQRPVAASRAGTEAAEYTVTPQMDLTNQRQSQLASASQTSHRDLGVPGKDVVATDMAADPPSAPVTPVAASPAIPKLETVSEVHSGVRIAHVSQLPPTTFVVPTAEIRRQMEARNLNLNTATIEGLERREATLAVINTHF